MCMRVAIIYNEPYPSRYDTAGEEKAVLGVLQTVDAVHHALIELGYTAEEAKERSLRAWVEKMKREDPMLVQMIMNVMAQELDQEEELAQIQATVKGALTGVNPTPKYGSKGGAPRTQNIKTESGAEMAPEESRPVRLPAS